MKMIVWPFVISIFISCTRSDDDLQSITTDPLYSTGEFDGVISSPFGDLLYRTYYPKELSGYTQAIIVSRGGDGSGDDRGKLYFYTEEFVKAGYVVVQVDHRNAGNSLHTISKFRGQEIQFISDKIKASQLNYGNFKGNVDGSKQGYFGHSAGCMEGLLAAGLNTIHGSYSAPAIKAIYGMSGVGYSPDVWGIAQSPNGFTAINETAIFLITGEQEKDSNGPGTVYKDDWRLQGYAQMNENELRIQVLVKGENTSHEDIGGLNVDLKNYSAANAKALFDTYLKSKDRKKEIGHLNKPPGNDLVITKKGY